MADNTADTTGADQGTGAAAGADDENAALIAELEAEQGKSAPAKPAGKAADAEEADDDEPAAEDDAEADADADETAAEDSEDDDEDLDEDEEDEEADDEDPEDELDEEAAKDPALKKRLEAVRRTEQRQRQRLEQDRAAFERERTEHQTETKKLRHDVDRIRGLASRAKVDPIGLLEAFGLGQDDMEYVAQLAYARGKAAAAKPEYRQAAERALRDREHAEELARNREELDKLKQGLAEREQQAAADRELDTYFGRVFRKADATATPITARLIAKRPKAARAELTTTAAKLTEKLGRMPKIGELLAEHEKREVRALKLRGIKPPAPSAAKPTDETTETDTPAIAAKGAAKKKSAPRKLAGAEADDAIDIPSTADLVRELQSSQRN